MARELTICEIADFFDDVRAADEGSDADRLHVHEQLKEHRGEIEIYVQRRRAGGDVVQAWEYDNLVARC